MSQNIVEKFLTDLSENKEYQEELKEIGNDVEKVTSFANSKGYDFKIDDFQIFLDTKKSELSDEKLDGVAGGGMQAPMMFPDWWKR